MEWTRPLLIGNYSSNHDCWSHNYCLWFLREFYVRSFLVGIYHGSQWSLMPSITSEIFGIEKNFWYSWSTNSSSNTHKFHMIGKSWYFRRSKILVLLEYRLSLRDLSYGIYMGIRGGNRYFRVLEIFSSMRVRILLLV